VDGKTVMIMCLHHGGLQVRCGLAWLRKISATKCRLGGEAKSANTCLFIEHSACPLSLAIRISYLGNLLYAWMGVTICVSFLRFPWRANVLTVASKWLVLWQVVECRPAAETIYPLVSHARCGGDVLRCLVHLIDQVGLSLLPQE